jgi:hypothetical protein
VAGLLLLGALCALLAIHAPDARAQWEEHGTHAFGTQESNLPPAGSYFPQGVAQPEEVVEIWCYPLGLDVDIPAPEVTVTGW